MVKLFNVKGAWKMKNNVKDKQNQQELNKLTREIKE